MKEIILYQYQNQNYNKEIKMNINNDNISIIEIYNNDDNEHTQNQFKHINIKKNDIAIIKYDSNYEQPKGKRNPLLITSGIIVLILSIIMFCYKLQEIGIAAIIIGITLFLIGILYKSSPEDSQSGSFRILNYKNEVIYSKNIILTDNEVKNIINSIHNQE